MTGELVLDRLPLHDVLALGQVAEDVEVAEPVELTVQLAAAFGVVAAEPLRLVADEVEDATADMIVGLEVVQPFDELRLERLGLGDRLAAALRVAAGRAEVAADAGAGAARAVHAGAAALAVEELAEQVVVRRAAGLEDAGAPEADLLDAVEELLVDERLVQPADRAVLAAEAADVAAVGGVDEHLANGVLAERAVLGGAGAASAEPLGERAVGLLAGRVALEQLADELGPLRVGDGESGIAVADVAPGERADEVPLPRLLAQAGACPERERDGVVLVEHLVDRLGEEEGRIGRVVADRLRDRDDADAEPVPEQGLVAPRLGLVPGEAGRVVDEHDVEALLGGVGHQTLELGPPVGLLPAAVEVGVVVDDLELVLVGEAADRLPLRIGREALALLLGRLTHVGDGACLTRLAGVALRSPRRSGAGATSRRTSGRTLRLPGGVVRSAHGRSLFLPGWARRHPRSDQDRSPAATSTAFSATAWRLHGMGSFELPFRGSVRRRFFVSDAPRGGGHERSEGSRP